MMDVRGRRYPWDKPPGRKPVYGQRMDYTLKLRASSEQYTALRKLALSERKTVAWVIRDAINAYLADGGDETIYAVRQPERTKLRQQLAS